MSSAKTDPKPAFKVSNARLLLWATLAASVALSLVSAYETYRGLLDFMEPGIAGQLASIVLTFGIQVLLFVISWSLANHLRDGFKANIYRWLIWGLCAFFSGYFSYYGFLATTGGRNEDIRLQAIDAEQNSVLQTVDESLTALLEAKHAELLRDSPEFANWQTNSLRALITTASTAESAIAQAATAERDRLGRQKLLLSTNLRAAQEVLRSATIEDDQVTNRREQLQSEIDGLRTQQQTMVGQVTTQQADVDSFQVQLAAELKTGAGPRSRQIQLDLNSAEAVLGGSQSQLIAIEASLAEKVDALALEDANAAFALEANRRTEAAAAVEALELQIKDIEAQIEISNQGAAFSFDQAEAQLDQNISRLIQKDYSAYDSLFEQCTNLKQQLTVAGLQASVAGVDCADPTVVEGIGKLRDLVAVQAGFVADCFDNAPSYQRVEGNKEALVNPVIEHAVACVRNEPDRRQRDQLIGRLNTLKTLRGDNADPITIAAVALFADRQGNAVLSAVFAIMVDVLVLLCALIGKNVGQPERVRAIDALFSHLKVYSGDQPRFSHQLDRASLPQNEAAIIEPLLGDLIRHEVGQADSRDPTIFLLEYKARDLLRTMRMQAIDGAEGLLDTLRPTTAETGGIPPRRKRTF